MGDKLGTTGKAGVRLVRGSHIIVKRLYAGDQGYILQQPDRRIVFAMPYLDQFTLIGTTDVPVDNPGDAVMDTDEVDYLCRAVNHYFAVQIGPDDVLSLYAGVRALYDDGAKDSMEVTRDYVLEMDGGDTEGRPALLSVFGGKITTARALADDALNRIGHATSLSGASWTKNAALPGGNLGMPFDDFLAQIEARYHFLDWENAKRLARAYGAMLPDILGEAQTMDDLGRNFGAGLTEREVDHLVNTEWATTAEDILMRRTKVGLLMTEQEISAFSQWFEELRQ
jgi:glycerol-3-phosphate dehydrogenase